MVARPLSHIHTLTVLSAAAVKSSELSGGMSDDCVELSAEHTHTHSRNPLSLSDIQTRQPHSPVCVYRGIAERWCFSYFFCSVSLFFQVDISKSLLHSFHHALFGGTGVVLTKNCYHLKAPAGFELATPGLRDQCSNH